MEIGSFGGPSSRSSTIDLSVGQGEACEPGDVWQGARLDWQGREATGMWRSWLVPRGQGWGRSHRSMTVKFLESFDHFARCYNQHVRKIDPHFFGVERGLILPPKPTGVWIIMFPMKKWCGNEMWYVGHAFFSEPPWSIQESPSNGLSKLQSICQCSCELSHGGSTRPTIPSAVGIFYDFLIRTLGDFSQPQATYDKMLKEIPKATPGRMAKPQHQPE